MLLHVPTIFISLFLSCALFAIALRFTRPLLGAGEELRLWERSNWLLLASFIGLFSRAFVPEWIAILLGNGLIFASLYMLSRALHHFVLQQEPPRWHLGMVLVGWACTALVMGSPLPVRTIVISCLYAVQLFAMAWLIVSKGWQAEASLRTVGVTLGLACAALVIRVVNAHLNPGDYNGYFQTSLGNGLTYLASFLFPLGAGFGFVLANLERTANRLDRLAAHDGMTDCLNRSAFDALLGNALERAQRSRTPASLIVMDLDDFKRINDTCGHPAGDAVLSAFARAMRARLRAGDAFGRLGGDEFAVLLTDTDMAQACSVAEVLRSTAEALVIPTPEGELLRITVSLGVSTADGEHPTTAQSLHGQADKSLYAAKQGGRNRAVRHSGEPRLRVVSAAP